MGEYANQITLGIVTAMFAFILWRQDKTLQRAMVQSEKAHEALLDAVAMRNDPGYGRIKAMQRRKEAQPASENRKTMSDLLNKVWGKKEQHKREQNRAGRDTRSLREKLRAGATVTSMAPADMPPPTTEEPPSTEGGS